ncbi:ComF family protein [Candidatus Saccharibacteria bacterium]|nr:ComF family protein [Candidatus Saccharibacteria bacterium]
MPNIVKKTTIVSLFDLLAPHSCRGCGRTGNPLCGRCKKYILKNHQNYCPNCKAKNPTGNCKTCRDLPAIFVVDERNSLIGELIYDLKFNSNRSLVYPLAEILDSILPTINGRVIIVPLPTNTKHVRARGLDHTLLIAKKLARIRGKNYQVEKILVRKINTVQVGSSAKERERQASSAYKINKKAKMNKDATYILLDDIWTTGASMKSALKKLRQAGAKKLIIAVLAVNSLN